MKVVRSRLDATGRTSRPIGGALYMPTTDRRLQQGPHARARRAAPGRPRARRGALLPAAWSRLPAPVVEMEGARADHARLQQLPRADGRPARDRRRAHDAIRRYGTGVTGSRLLNGTLDLHLELEAELADWMGTEDAIVFTTGHQANLGALGTILGPEDTVVVDSGDHASILDGVLLSRAKLRAFRHNRLDLLEKRLGAGGGRRRRDPRRRRRRLLDGGRRRAAAGDRRPVPALRRAADGRRGARRSACSARAAPARASCSASRTASTCGWRTFSKSLASCGGVIAGPADVIDFLRIQSRAVPLHRLGRAGRRRRGAGGRAHLPLGRGPRAVRPRAGQRRVPERAACASSASTSSTRSRCRTARRVATPIVPVLVGDDWKAALLWKALYDAGVYVNVALHPAVPPGGALLRTSVMATHDRRDARRARSTPSPTSSATFEAEHGPLPSAG